MGGLEGLGMEMGAGGELKAGYAMQKLILDFIRAIK